LISILSATLWWGWDRVKAVNALPEQVGQNTQQIAEMGPKLDRILVLMEQAIKRDLTVTGEVSVVQNGHQSGPCLWINESSAAAVYQGMKQVRVINLDDPNRRSTRLTIRGTINTSNELVGEICKTAAGMLNASNKEALHVRIEPVTDELARNGP
jgi:hypothetical protein